MRTVPDIEGAVTKVELSIRYIDNAGKKRAVSARIAAATTDATVEALVEALSDATSANIWRVDLSRVWAGLPTASTVDAEQNSVWDQGIILFKTADGLAQDIFLPALVEGAMDGDSNNIDTSAVVYTTARDAWEAALANGFEPISARYTQRSEFNKAVPA